MEILILASGLGSRMGELTAKKPKAMVEFRGKSLIEHLLAEIAKFSFETIHINIFHHKELFRKFIEEELQAKFPNQKINIIEENEHLESGGSILNALANISSENFFCINCDIFFENLEINIFQEMLSYWKKLPESKKALLLVKSVEQEADFTLSSNRTLQRPASGKNQLYEGIQILNKNIFKKCALKKFSLFKEFIFPQFLIGERLNDFYGINLKQKIHHVGTIDEMLALQENS